MLTVRMLTAFLAARLRLRCDAKLCSHKPCLQLCRDLPSHKMSSFLVSALNPLPPLFPLSPYSFCPLLSCQTLASEMARLNRSREMSRSSQADKEASDRATFTAWLGRYGARLQREATAGADAEARVQLMNSSNPK